MADSQRFRHDIAEGFRTLARARLDALARDQVIGDLDESERQALALLEGRQREVDALAKKRDELQAVLEDAEAEKHERDQELADALDAIDELYDRATERVKADSHWHDAKAAVATAVEDAYAADKKAADAEADRARASKSYENSPLFMYLWNKHARPNGNGTGAIGRTFDRMIERFIRYHEARARYETLLEIPVVMREQARNKARDIDTARANVAALEHQALVTNGLNDLEVRAESARTAAVLAEQTVARITSDLGEIEAKRQWTLEADDKKSEHRAVDLLAQALEREDLRRLYRDAASTQTSADDHAVAAISSAQTALRKADGDIVRVRTQLREMARRRRELEGTRDRARSIGYDDPRARFDGEGNAIGDVIGGILSGAIQGAALDRLLRNSYRAPTRRADPGFGRWDGASPSPHLWGKGEDTTQNFPGNGWRPDGGS
jgi:hypothetical protein